MDCRIKSGNDKRKPGKDIRKESPAMTVLLCPSQTPPEQRGHCGTIPSIRRAPAVQVIPGAVFFLFLSSPGCVFLCHPRALYFLVIPGYFISFSSSPGFDPGIQVNNKANLLTWIAGSSPAMTIEKKSPAMTKESPAMTIEKKARKRH